MDTSTISVVNAKRAVMHFSNRAILFVVVPISIWTTRVDAADIYKWTDSEGRIHYGERKLEGKARSVELRDSSPPPTQPSVQTGSVEYWREQERQMQQRLTSKREADVRQSATRQKPPDSLSGGTAKWQDTDQWRCNLAKDIISGGVKRSSGRPTTPDDIRLAEENVRAFCR